MSELTEAQRRALAAIRSCIKSRGYPPTLREIATAVGLRTVNGVLCHVNALEKKGYIQRDRKTVRGIRVLRTA